MDNYDGGTLCTNYLETDHTWCSQCATVVMCKYFIVFFYNCIYAEILISRSINTSTMQILNSVIQSLANTHTTPKEKSCINALWVLKRDTVCLIQFTIKSYNVLNIHIPTLNMLWLLTNYRLIQCITKVPHTLHHQYLYWHKQNACLYTLTAKHRSSVTLIMSHMLH